MDERPTSPFAGLDKALLKSTRDSAAPAAPADDQRSNQSTTRPKKQPSGRRASHTTDQPTGQSVDRSTDQSTAQSTRRRGRSSTKTGNKIVNRPKAFYITERLDERLDDAVRYFQQAHGLRKVDRSTVMNAMLDNDTQWSDESLDQLVDRLISLLTSRLTGR